MRITTRALGEIELAEGQIIEMPSGMIGFPAAHRYALIPFEDSEVPFLWWQCLDEPSLSFIVIDPLLIYPDYEVALPAAEFEDIALASVSDGAVYVVVTVPKDPSDMTVNLMGPLVINQSARRAKQLVLTDSRYTTRHPVLRREAPGHACANSQNG
jgi:flagellar assembly factor FliW